MTNKTPGKRTLTDEQLQELEAHIGADAMKVWDAFCDYFGEGNTPDNCIDAYHGQWESELDYAYDYVESCGMLDGVADFAKTYFDYEAFARDMFINDVTMTDGGYVFATCW